MMWSASGLGKLVGLHRQFQEMAPVLIGSVRFADSWHVLKFEQVGLFSLTLPHVVSLESLTYSN